MTNYLVVSAENFVSMDNIFVAMRFADVDRGSKCNILKWMKGVKCRMSKKPSVFFLIFKSIDFGYIDNKVHYKYLRSQLNIILI